MSTDKSAVTGDLARQNVHSAIIINQTSNTIHCLVEYGTLSGTDNEIVEFDINGNGEERKCEEKVHSAGTHDSSHSNVFPKVISSLQIKRSDGSNDKLTAPFDNVPHEDVRNWKFIVNNDGIHSQKKEFHFLSMLLIQQSPWFRAWTSRALLAHFRRALLFLVVSSRESTNNEQQQTVYFSDAEDDEEVLMIDNEKMPIESLYDRNLLKEYVWKKLSQGLNNSMIKTIHSSGIESTSSSSSSVERSLKIFDSIQRPSTEQFELNTISINSSFSSWPQTPVNYHNQINTCLPYGCHFNCTVPMVSHPYCSPRCSSSTCDSPDNESSSSKSNNSLLPRSSHRYSSTSIEQNTSQSSDDEENIYEKYQTSFSHILHQTKSQHAIRKENKIQSMLSFEPNTSIIAVRQLILHPFHSNYIDPSIITNDICVRLIADRTDSSIQCDTKPMGCEKTDNYPHINEKPLGCFPIKSIPVDNLSSPATDQSGKDQSFISKFEATSILIDIPFKILYIDSLA